MSIKNIVFSLFTILILSSFSTSMNVDLIGLLESYTQLYIEKDEAYTTKNQLRLRDINVEIEKFHEEELLPALKKIKFQFCNSEDSLLLNAYVDMLVASRGSASEAPWWTFGEMYICHPDRVGQVIKESDNVHLLVNNLSFGFENVIHHSVDTSDLDMVLLRNNIEKLKPKKVKEKPKKKYFNVPTLLHDPNGKDYVLTVEPILEIEDFEMKIYDRWGEQLFYSDDLNNLWNAKKMPEAVYIWYIKGTDNGKEITQTGFVEVKK